MDPCPHPRTVRVTLDLPVTDLPGNEQESAEFWGEKVSQIIIEGLEEKVDHYFDGCYVIESKFI